jgi:hypothetical protein
LDSKSSRVSPTRFLSGNGVTAAERGWLEMAVLVAWAWVEALVAGLYENCAHNKQRTPRMLPATAHKILVST